MASKPSLWLYETPVWGRVCIRLACRAGWVEGSPLEGPPKTSHPSCRESRAFDKLWKRPHRTTVPSATNCKLRGFPRIPLGFDNLSAGFTELTGSYSTSNHPCCQRRIKTRTRQRKRNRVQIWEGSRHGALVVLSQGVVGSVTSSRPRRVTVVHTVDYHPGELPEPGAGVRSEASLHGPHEFVAHMVALSQVIPRDHVAGLSGAADSALSHLISRNYQVCSRPTRINKTILSLRKFQGLRGRSWDRGQAFEGEARFLHTSSQHFLNIHTE